MSSITIKGFIESKPNKSILQYKSEFVPRTGESLKYGEKIIYIKNDTYVIDKTIEVHLIISKEDPNKVTTAVDTSGHMEVDEESFFNEEQWDNN